MVQRTRLQGLFKGKKPRALHGGVSKKERIEYKRLLGLKHSTVRPVGRMPLKRILGELVSYQTFMDTVFTARKMDMKTAGKVRQETKRLRKLIKTNLQPMNIAQFKGSKQRYLEHLKLQLMSHNWSGILGRGKRYLEALEDGTLERDFSALEEFYEKRRIDKKFIKHMLETPFFGTSPVTKTIMEEIIKRTGIKNRKFQNNVKELNVREMHVVKVPSMLFTEIMSELLMNAAHHTKPGDTITINAKVQGNKTILSVTDTGKGISPENLEKLKRQKRFSTRGGTGSGHRLIGKILKEVGGTKQITSKLGKGTTVTITIPSRKFKPI